MHYTSSIEDGTYNRVKLVYKNEDTGKAESYIAKDSENERKWGLLQYYEVIDDQKRIKMYAEQQLKSSNLPKRTFNLKGTSTNNYHLRAGFLIPVVYNQNPHKKKSGELMLLTTNTVSHKWDGGGNHTMDINLNVT